MSVLHPEAPQPTRVGGTQSSILEVLNGQGQDTVPPPEVVAAGLRYVMDASPGFRRVRSGRGFRYLDLQDRSISNPGVLTRIRGLAVPPAWKDVWICPLANGHLQATGRDDKGRKQYIYHENWRYVRDETKYQAMLNFGAHLPEIRAQVDKDLSNSSDAGGISRRRVLATLVRLLDQTAIRVGNEQYARENDSFGLTTLRSRHVDVSGSTIRLRFRGKGGKERSLAVQDRRVSNVVKKLHDLPGQDLFRYRDDCGELRSVGSADVNEYLQEISGLSISAKDFRTWTASCVAAETLVALSEASEEPRKTVLNRALDEAARRLGNTRTVCRNSYVHPQIIRGYDEGWLALVWKAAYMNCDTSGLERQETAMLAVIATGAQPNLEGLRAG